MSETLTDRFRQAMRRAPGSVYILATAHNGLRGGMTATAVTSLSFEPLSMLACVHTSASCYGLLQEAGRFSLSLLPPETQDVAIAFSTLADAEERFQVGDWTERDGLPVLASAVATITLSTISTHRAGTHTIFIGDVGSVDLQDAGPALLYGEGAFGAFQA
ncbi:MAG: flavin reductase family protein [Pseudomonadota bacterium]